MADPSDYDIPVYAPAARRFHWWVAGLILIQLPARSLDDLSR